MPATNDAAVLDIALSDEAYATICQLVKARAGIDLGKGKRLLVQGRLARRVRQLGLRDFGAYLEHVHDPRSDESTRFLNALTTNVTEFFREVHHFELLEARALPDIWRKHARDKRVRIWSAGCSTGEEPYSIAMTVAQHLPRDAGWDVKILATDIDSDVLAHAADGVYPEAKIERLQAEYKRAFFRRGTGKQQGMVRVTAELQRMITWKRLNLLDGWPMHGPFDVIFCRNVVIYFDPPTRQLLTERFVDILDDAAYLFVGHSESLVQNSLPLLSCGRTAYQKKMSAGASS